MGLFDFLFGGNSQKKGGIASQNSVLDYPVSKKDMQDAQAIAKELDGIFYHSSALRQLGNRNQVMHSRMLSYRSMLAYIYERDYNYGSSHEYIDIEESSHCQLVFAAMSDKSHRNMSVAQLSNNWLDVLKVVEALKMAEPDTILPMESKIKKLTDIINRIK